MFINSKGGALSQYICISDHYVVHFNYFVTLLANYTSVKLRKKIIWKTCEKTVVWPLS